MASCDGRQRWRRLLLSSAVVVLWRWTAGVEAAPTPQMKAGNQLNDATFDQRISSGLWMVEHYSPFCKHCKAFAPTWIELVEGTKEWEARGLHYGQVDCVAQGDLCSRLEVKYYPYLRLYQDGNHSDVYDGDRTVDALRSYLDSRSAEYMANNPLPQPPPPPDQPEERPLLADLAGPEGARAEDQRLALEMQNEVRKEEPEVAVAKMQAEEATTEAMGLQPPGSAGEVIALTKDTWRRYAEAGKDVGPTFIKYFAPWCGHCKALAPTWVDLAHLLRGTANVAELDCDASENKAICKDEGVRAFPTLFFYQEGSKSEYRGSRSLTQMEAFAKKAAAAHGMRDISSSELQQVMHDEEVFFLLLYTSATPKHIVPAVHAVADTFLGSAIVFKSDSAALYERFSLPQDQPFLLVFKDFDDSPYNELQLPTGTTPQVLRGRVRSWIRDEKHALVPELGSDNVDDLTRPADRLLLILGVLNADQDRVSAVRMQEEMRQFARRWRNSDEARQVSTHVQWAWINADVSAPWLKNNYGYVATEQAGLLILDPHRFEYYDRDSRGLPFPWLADGIMRAIVDVEQGKMKAKTSRSYGEKVVHSLDTMAAVLSWFVTEHYILFGLSFVGAFLVLVKALLWALDTTEYVRPSDRTRQRSGYTYRPPYTKAD